MGSMTDYEIARDEKSLQRWYAERGRSDFDGEFWFRPLPAPRLTCGHDVSGKPCGQPGKRYPGGVACAGHFPGTVDA